jgi:transcriptional regulator GlxA family with amidase domain
MNTRLKHTQNWQKLAQEANWSVSKTAKLCGVSVRTLERHFFVEMGKTPKTWLVEQRQKQAMELLRNGCSVKETASQLGYQYAQHFSREFKWYWGRSPTGQMASTNPTISDCRVLV